MYPNQYGQRGSRGYGPPPSHFESQEPNYYPQQPQQGQYPQPTTSSYPPPPPQQGYYLQLTTSSHPPPPYPPPYEDHSYRESLHHTKSTRSSSSSASGDTLTAPFNDPSTAQEQLSASDQDLLSKLLIFTTTIPPPPTNHTILPRPIIVPRIGPGRSVPFAMAYAPSLAASSLPAPSFLTFLTNLNIISSPNPAMSSLSSVGSLIGMVPYHWAQAAGAGIEASATLATIMINKVRVGRYLAEINRLVFAPRRMKVRILNGKEVMSLFRIVRDEDLLGEGEGLLEVLLDGFIRRFGAEIEIWEMNEGDTKTELGFLDRWSKKQVMSKKKKMEEKEIKRRGKEIKKEGKRLDKEVRKADKRKRKELKRERKGKGRKESDSSSEDDEGPVRDTGMVGATGISRKAKKRYLKQAKKMLYVVVENV